MGCPRKIQTQIVHLRGHKTPVWGQGRQMTKLYCEFTAVANKFLGARVKYKPQNLVQKGIPPPNPAKVVLHFCVLLLYFHQILFVDVWSWRTFVLQHIGLLHKICIQEHTNWQSPMGALRLGSGICKLKWWMLKGEGQG